MSNNWCAGNKVELLINGDEFFPALFEEIRKAKSEVIIETFILCEDSVGHELQRELIKAARRGLRVEITVDDYGTWDLNVNFVKALTEAGVKLHIFDPQPRIWGVRLNMFRRLHRKIVVIDKTLAFVGGINYSADHNMDFGEMAKQDYAVKISGPVVSDIHHSVMLLLMRTSSKQDRKNYIKQRKEDSISDVGTVKAQFIERDNWIHKRDIERHYLHALQTAKERVVIANAYFFPGYRLLRELRRASQRGVKVTLILQGQPDMPWVSALSRLLYTYLLRAGVTIYEYCQRPLHGKVALMDNEWVTVGSSNLDPLSLALNLEANLVLQDHEFNQTLFKHLNDLSIKTCKEIDIEVAERGYWWRTPVIFFSFHFLRMFPTMVGWIPAHAPTAKLVAKKIAKEKESENQENARTPEINKANGV